MAEYNPSLEECTSDLNLSIHKTRVSTPSEFVPNFFHRPSFETDRRDHSEPLQFTHDLPNRQASTTKSFQVEKKPPRPRQSITDIIEQATQSVSAKYRPRPLSMSLGNNVKRETSPAGRLYNTSALNSPLRAKTAKHAKVPRSRDGSPIVKSQTRLSVERRIMNRSVELKSVISQENQEHVTRGKMAGKVVLGSTNQRKEIEKQVQSLENRLNRLRIEEANSLKKVDNATRDAEKALANKMRHKEDLLLKEIKNRKREESVQKRRNEINQEREETKMKASTAVLELLKSRYNHAQKMKKIAEEGKAREEERRRREEEKKKAVKEGIKTWIKSTKTIKLHNENLNKRNSSVSYNEKARIEKERAQDLLAKCKQMEEMEQELLNRLGQTRALHISKLNELRSIQSANVSYGN